jgi:hypothetical protein
MNDGALHHDETAHHVGMPAAMVLRAIDWGLVHLRGLRGRFDTADEAGDDSRHSGWREAEREVPPPAAEVHAQGLLHRMLVILMCLLLGAAAGALFSYHGFSRTLQSRDAMIEFMQEERAQSQKEDALNLAAKAKYQSELIDYRKQLRETQAELDDARNRIDSLSSQVNAMKLADQRTRGVRPGSVPAQARRAPVPQKTGTCVTGTANLTGNIAGCIEKFNER